MKKYLSLLIFFSAVQISFSQQDKQLTHYVFDKMSFNPATTGFKGLCGTLIYRNQWDRVQDAPNTTLLNFQANIPRHNLGVGLSFTNDVIGFQKNKNLTINGAYHLPTSAGVLSAGIGIGLINVAFLPSWIPPETIEDPLLPVATSGSGFDANLGLYWHGNNIPIFAGISTTHLVPSTINSINYTVARHYYAIAGYDFNVSGRRIIHLKPSVLIKTDAASMIFDVNVMADVWLNTYSYLWGGLSYRLADAVALNMGFAFSPAQIPSVNMMKIGYSFDFMTNALNPYGKGSHELMLNFCIFPPQKGHGRNGNPFILQ